MNRKYQIAVLYVLPLTAVIVSRLLNANFLLTLILFWGMPSLILTLWSKGKALKAALFAGVATIILTGLDIIFWANKQWMVVSQFKSTFLGLVAWEDIPYWFLFAYFPIMFWEHFYEHDRSESVWGQRMSRFLGATVMAFLAISAAWLWFPKLILVPYFYLVFTLVCGIVPLALELWEHPRLGMKFLRVGLYFTYVAILYELTALSLGQWYYPSNQFIGWVDFNGLRFPVEEFIAWILLGGAAVLSGYEHFDDYRRRNLVK